jgi:hypothetical protein
MALVLFAGACSRGGATGSVAAPPESPAQTQARTQQGEQQRVAARERVVQSGCDRAEACNSVGVQKVYASRQECEIQLRGEAEAQLNPTYCAGRVSAPKLNDCLNAVNTRGCEGIEAGWLDGLSACHTDQVCTYRAPAMSMR